MKRLTPPSEDTYVTGISNDIQADNVFHLTMFDPDARKLWYLKADTESTSDGTALLIQDNIDNIRETVFFYDTHTGTLKD